MKRDEKFARELYLAAAQANAFKYEAEGFETHAVREDAELHAVLYGKVADALNSHSKSIRGAKILVLGIAYKRDIDDVRESPALDVMAVLQQKGAEVSYHDPYIPAVAGRDWPGAIDISTVDLNAERMRSSDCVVIITDHKAFDYGALTKHARLIVDTRNAIKGAHPHVFKLGAPAA